MSDSAAVSVAIRIRRTRTRNWTWVFSFGATAPRSGGYWNNDLTEHMVVDAVDKNVKGRKPNQSNTHGWKNGAYEWKWMYGYSMDS
jgi:hypothetical protein